MPLRIQCFVILLSISVLLGCSSEPEPSPDTTETALPESTETTAVSTGGQSDMESGDSATAPPVRRGPVTLGGGVSATPETATATDSQTPTAEDASASIFDAIKPLQILMGSWEGKTQKQFGEFSAVDEPEWVWDFLTNKDQPALVMSSEKSPYFKKLRLTYDPGKSQYLLSASHEDYGTRSFVGEFTQDIEDVPGDDKKLHRTYKLEFTQIGPEGTEDQWQIVINQKDNNRYLLEMSKKRGAANFLRFDTVASQRQGTSFALSDSDYGEKTCIVSGGLGTATVSFEGKTYYVCCSGCSAAFNEEPERWIAKALEDAKSKEASQ